MTVYYYDAVMMVREPHDLSLEALSEEVARLLAEQGLLGAAPDARVSAAPDARTVRYYTTLGLLDRPTIEGRQARYGKRHARQLLAVKALQASALPLAEIQRRLYGRSDAELEALVPLLASQARERAEIPAPLPALSLREIAVAPGLRLVVEDGWKLHDEAELTERIRAALAALVRPRGAREG